MSEELKPCPFCGGVVRLNVGFAGSKSIVCDRCGAEVFFRSLLRPHLVCDKPIEHWNRRAEVGNDADAD